MKSEIKCEFINDRIRYNCIVTAARINHPKIKISAFSGEHHEGKSNNDVTTLIFKNCQVEYFPRGIAQHFPTLKSLILVNCRLKEIARKDLVGLQNLTCLWLQNNELVSLATDLLEDMKELIYIGIRERNLKFIDSRIFEPLKNQFIQINFSGHKNIQAIYNQSTCQINEFMKFIDEKSEKPLQDRHKKLQSIFEQFWETRCFSDFTIKVDKKEIKVHKNVLGTQSSVFAAMFNNDMAEKKSSEMTINEFSYSSVEEFLEYFYTGLFPGPINAMEIFALSAKYDVQELMLEMEEIIVCNIASSSSSSNDAVETLVLGNLYCSEELMSVAFERIKTMNPDINFAGGLMKHPEDLQKLIEAKRQYDRDIEHITAKFNELEKVLNVTKIESE